MQIKVLVLTSETLGGPGSGYLWDTTCLWKGTRGLVKDPLPEGMPSAGTLKPGPFSDCVQQREQKLACKFTSTIMQERISVPQHVGLQRPSRERWRLSVQPLSALSGSSILSVQSSEVHLTSIFSSSKLFKIFYFQFSTSVTYPCL